MGKHIGGQQTLDVPEQAVCRGQVGTRHMPDDLRQRLWRVAVYHGGGIVDARRLQQTGADLVQLDAIAADFDLVVGSALKTQFAVETQGDLVAGDRQSVV